MSGVVSMQALFGRGAQAESNDPGEMTRQGMARFSAGDLDGSLAAFDAVHARFPRYRPYLWQRGLSLYYAERVQDGALQFAEDVAVNPNDTEEAIWHLLCEARRSSSASWPEEGALLMVGVDKRPYMRAAYDLFDSGGKGEVDDLLAVGDAAGQDSGPWFYTRLYAGLYEEARKRDDASRSFVLEAVNSPYGKRSGDYMAAVARMHAKVRGYS